MFVQRRPGTPALSSSDVIMVVGIGTKLKLEIRKLKKMQYFKQTKQINNQTNKKTSKNQLKLIQKSLNRPVYILYKSKMKKKIHQGIKYK